MYRETLAKGCPKFNKRAVLFLVCVGITASVAMAQQRPTASQLERAGTEPQNWMTYYGNYNGTSYSQLDQISRKNVKQLSPAWAMSAGGPPADSTLRPGLESAPLVVDGVLYLEGNQNNVYAFDADTGRIRWKYIYQWPAHGPAEGSRGARGIAIGDGRVYMGTQDNHLVSLDAESGKEVWSVTVEDPSVCHCSITAAPLFIRGKVITGVAGVGRSRGYIRAFEASTGKLDWNFDVVPSPDQPGGDTWPAGSYKTGGTATWYTGTYDPELNTIYWGTGDPGPTYQPDVRLGANLYSDCLLALDADTGKLKWYNQEIPHDPYDFDSASEPILIDAEIAGAKRKLLVHPTKGGFTYVYDRVSGKMLHAFPYTAVNWTKGLDSDGKPIDMVNWQHEKDFVICPGIGRGKGTNHSAYSPRTGWWYTIDMSNCSQITDGKDTRMMNPTIPPNIAAFDPLTGKKQWTFNTTYYDYSSLLATAGDLIFGGDLEGNAFALDAKTGEQLWSFNTGEMVVSPPITYSVKGRQYLAIATGGGSTDERTIGVYAPGADDHMPSPGATLFVFALPTAGK